MNQEKNVTSNTVDVQRVTAAATGLWSALVLPAQMVLAMVLLWRAIGASMLAGLAGMVVILSANYVIAGYQKSVSEQVMDQKDERMKATTEMLNAMRQIKLDADNHRARVIIPDVDGIPCNAIRAHRPSDRDADLIVHQRVASIG